MATGRTTRKHLRVYAGQYGDWNNDVFAIGPLLQEYDAPMGAAFADEVKNAVGGISQARISAGVLQGYLHAGSGNFHPEASGLLSGAADAVIVSTLIGIRAAPAQGDPAFSGVFRAGAYTSLDLPGDGIVAARLPLEQYAATAEFLPDKAMGFVLDPGDTARTAANSGSGVDNSASSANGAWGFLHLLATNGTCTFSIQDSTDDAVYATLMTFDAAGDSVTSEIQNATGTVDRYARWQISLGTATSVTFVMVLVRG